MKSKYRVTTTNSHSTDGSKAAGSPNSGCHKTLQGRDYQLFWYFNINVVVVCTLFWNAQG